MFRPLLNSYPKKTFLKTSLQKAPKPLPLPSTMQDLLPFVRQLVSLPASEEAKLLAIAHPAKLGKGRFFVKEGEVPQKLAFVHRGLFRYFYLDKKGNEYTKNFIPEGHFITSYSAMVIQQPSKMYIEALEDSEISTIQYTDWLQLKEGHPCWNQFLVRLLEYAFSIKEARERDLLLLEAEERYQIFLKDFPTLEQRVKQHLIASYLGISPVSLSRIKTR